MSNYGYDAINVYNAVYPSPSTVHCSNTGLVKLISRYLLDKVVATYKINNLPDNWAKNFVQYMLFGGGYFAVLNTDLFGILPQPVSLSGYDAQYQPKTAIITNEAFKETYNLTIGEETEIVKLFPDYRSIMPLVIMYADLMALCLEDAGINLLNSKFSFIFAAEDKAQAETFKKMYDNIASGEPCVTVGKKTLKGPDGTPNYQLLIQNVGQNYITDKILNDLKTIEDRFNTVIGIPNANTQKRERLITNEVNANNYDTECLAGLIVDTVNESMQRVNKMFGLNISLEYRWGGVANGNI